MLRVVRKSSYKATPWKNGGGITHEAMRVPANGPAFRWRISVAHIDASGPFSEFAQYNRTMVLLQGAGIELRFAGGEQRLLRRVGELVEFDGASSVYCELLDGACVDLNLMVAKSGTADVRLSRLQEPLTVKSPGNKSTLVFAIDGSIRVAADTGEAETLEPWDLALLSQCGARLSRSGPESSALNSMLLATLSD